MCFWSFSKHEMHPLGVKVSHLYDVSLTVYCVISNTGSVDTETVEKHLHADEREGEAQV